MYGVCFLSLFRNRDPHVTELLFLILKFCYLISELRVRLIEIQFNYDGSVPVSDLYNQHWFFGIDLNIKLRISMNMHHVLLFIIGFFRSRIVSKIPKTSSKVPSDVLLHSRIQKNKLKKKKK